MAKRREQPAELEDFLEMLPPAPPPENLGNIPDDLDPPAPRRGENRGQPVEAQSAETDVSPPDEPPVETQADEPEDNEPVDQPQTTDSDRRLQELEQRLQSQSREIEFLRRGSAPQAAESAPASLDPRAILPFNVTEDDVAQVLMGGPKAAEYILNALRATAYAASVATENRLTAMYQQQQSATATADQIRSMFWNQNPDLADYQDIVAIAAQQVAGEMPHGDAATLVDATSRRARERLGQLGVRLQPAQPRGPRAVQSAPRTTRRPAVAETGGGRSGNGAARLNPVEKDILQLFNSR